MRMLRHHLCAAAMLAAMAHAALAQTAPSGAAAPLMIREQGSFLAGGSVVTHPGTFSSQRLGNDGQTIHGDHAYVFYQIPVNARRLPLVFWHGNAQTSKTWETTPDGREGFQNIFLRRNFGVYLVDQPRRGRAGQSTAPLAQRPDFADQRNFDVHRLGLWPNLFPGVQFSPSPEALNQFFRQAAPNTGPFDIEVVSNAGAALFGRIGEGILVTHSAGGGPGWYIGMKSPNVRAIVAYEPGSSFVFPEGEVPPPMPSSFAPLAGVGVKLADFMALTRIPIIIYYGDNIPSSLSPNMGQDAWRVRLDMARLWRDAVNRRGGDVTVVHLPEIGIRGNTHFPFFDLNNIEIADLMSRWLREKRLD